MKKLRLLIGELVRKYGKDRLCFMLPLRRFCEEPMSCKGGKGNERGACLSEYVSAMREILSENEIDYIDLYENGFPKPLTDKGDEYTVDGLHPNDKGHRLIANLVCEYIRKKMPL